MNPNEKAWTRKKRLEQALSLTPDDTGLVEEAAIAQPQEAKQEDLDFYQEMFAEAAQRQFPIRNSDRQELKYFQRVLHLRDDDAANIEQQVMHQMGVQPGDYMQDDPQSDDALVGRFDPPMSNPLPNPVSNPLADSSVNSPAVTSPPQPTAQPVDILSGEGSTTPTANQAAVQQTLRRRLENHPANLGQTQPPDNPQAMAEPPTAANASQADPALRLSPFNLPPDPAPPGQFVPPVQPAAPAQSPETVMQAAAMGSAPAQSPPVTAVAAAPLASATPKPATAKAAPARRPLIAKRVLFPLIGFLMGLTALGVIAYMVLPRLQAGKADPEKAQQYVKWGTEKTQQGEYGEGINDFNDAIRLNPSSADAYINRGYAKHRLNDLNGAIDDYEQAIKIDPNSAQAYSNMSHVQFDQRKYDEAARSAQRAIELKRDMPEAHLNLGNAKAATGDIEGAAAEFRTTLGLKAASVTHARAYNNLGNVAAARQQFDEAIQNYNEATQRDANYADAFYNRGLAYDRQGNGDNAVRDLTKAAELYQAQGDDRRSTGAKQKSEQIQNGRSSTPLPPATPPSPGRSI